MTSLLPLLAFKGTLVLLLGAAAAFLLRRSSASLQHCVWTSTFAALLAVPALGALGPSWRVAPLPGPTTAQTALATRPASSSEQPSERTARQATSSRTRASDQRGSAGATFGRILSWLGRLWALGVAVVSLVWLRGALLGWRLVESSRALEDARWSARVRTAAQASGLRGPVRLLRSDVLPVPVAWGWGRAAVVLPRQSVAWDDERAHAVLMHEMAHLRRRDAWSQVVAQAALALHWPNPLAWLAYRRFLDAREHACDDAVLQVGVAPAAYAAHLAAVAREMVAATPGPAWLPSATVAPMAARCELEDRVRSILDRSRARAPLSGRALGSALVLSLALGLPLAACQPSQRIAEAPARESVGRPAQNRTGQDSAQTGPVPDPDSTAARSARRSFPKDRPDVGAASTPPEPPSETGARTDVSPRGAQRTRLTDDGFDAARWGRAEVLPQAAQDSLDVSRVRLRASDERIEASRIRLQESQVRIRASQVQIQASEARIRASDVRIRESAVRIRESEMRIQALQEQDGTRPTEQPLGDPRGF